MERVDHEIETRNYQIERIEKELEILSKLKARIRKVNVIAAGFLPVAYFVIYTNTCIAGKTSRKTREKQPEQRRQRRQ